MPFPDLSTVGLDTLLLRMDGVSGAGASIHDANLFTYTQAGYSGPVLLHDGDAMRERLFWSRFIGPDTLISVHAILRERADVPVYELDLLISNGLFDPTFSPFRIHTPADGEVFFNKIRLRNLPAGWDVATATPRPSISIGPATGPLIIETLGAGLQQLLSVPNGLIRRFVLYDPIYASEAADILNMFGHGRMTGANSYYVRNAYGPEKTRLPGITSDFAYNGFTGREALRETQTRDLAPRLAALASGAPGGGIAEPAYGWMHPLDDHSGDDPADTGVAPFTGFAHIREGWLNYRLLSDMAADRANCWIFNKADGSILEPKAWADGNDPAHTNDGGSPAGGIAGQAPWDVEISGAADTFVPVVVPRGIANTDDEDGHLPEGNAWNVPETGDRWSNANAPHQEQHRPTGTQIPGGAFVEGFAPYPESHAIRGANHARAMVWGVNDQMSKLFLRAYANLYAYATNPYGVAGTSRVVDGQLTDMVGELAALVGNENNAIRTYDAAAGWKVNLAAIRYALEDDAFRTDGLLRIQTAIDVLDTNRTPVGYNKRVSPPLMATVDKPGPLNTGSTGPYTDVLTGGIELRAPAQGGPSSGVYSGGSGTLADPYVFENYEIHGAIDVWEDHTLIRNCLIYGVGPAGSKLIEPQSSYNNGVIGTRIEDCTLRGGVPGQVNDLFSHVVSLNNPTVVRCHCSYTSSDGIGTRGGDALGIQEYSSYLHALGTGDAAAHADVTQESGGCNGIDAHHIGNYHFTPQSNVPDWPGIGKGDGGIYYDAFNGDISGDIEIRGNWFNGGNICVRIGENVNGMWTFDAAVTVIDNYVEPGGVSPTQGLINVDISLGTGSFFGEGNRWWDPMQPDIHLTLIQHDGGPAYPVRDTGGGYVNQYPYGAGYPWTPPGGYNAPGNYHINSVNPT